MADLDIGVHGVLPLGADPSIDPLLRAGHGASVVRDDGHDVGKGSSDRVDISRAARHRVRVNEGDVARARFQADSQTDRAGNENRFKSLSERERDERDTAARGVDATRQETTTAEVDAGFVRREQVQVGERQDQTDRELTSAERRRLVDLRRRARRRFTTRLGAPFRLVLPRVPVSRRRFVMRQGRMVVDMRLTCVLMLPRCRVIRRQP